jgi:hypothetical protein
LNAFYFVEHFLSFAQELAVVVGATAVPDSI